MLSEKERFFPYPQRSVLRRRYCSYDTSMDTCPEEAEEIHLLDWEPVWQSEDELMRRLHSAVSRQWGMLMYYESGK
jgi:hypothetical protein